MLPYSVLVFLGTYLSRAKSSMLFIELIWEPLIVVEHIECASSDGGRFITGLLSKRVKILRNKEHVAATLLP